MMIKNIEKLKEHILSCYPQEGCGIVVDNTFIPLPNEADNPAEHFKIADEVYFNYPETIQGIIHSHTMHKFVLDGRTPSIEDMKGAEATQLPWGIVHCDGENVSEILWFNTKEIPDLLNRPYIPNVYDCFTLSRDYYRKYYSYDVGIHPRPENWEEWNITYLMNAFLEYDFKKSSKEIFKPGDVLLFRIGANYPTHLGIAVSDTQFIHHLYNKKSCLDNISRWKRHIHTKYEFIGNHHDT